MKKILILLFFVATASWAQVGIGTTDPNATLDIRATNPTTGLNTDGILIPRVDDFPLTVDNPGANQDGMLVFVTGNGTPTKGFYFWNNTIANWEKIRTGENNNIPFVTRTELDAITTPEDGQLVYNSTNDVTLMWNGSNWIVLSDDCFPQPTIANAGANQVYNDATTSPTLAANTPIEGAGLWTIISGAGGSFADATNSTTIFTGNPCTTYALRWTITSACGSSNDDTIITFNQMPTTATTGATQNYTDATTSTVLTGNTPIVGAGQWTIVSGTGGSFADATDPTTTFTGNACSTYRLRWTITSTCGNISTNVLDIFFQETPTTANAGPDQTLTDNVTTTVTLAANTPTIGTGLWTIIIGTGGSFADATDPTTTFTGNLCTSYTLRWRITQCNSSSDNVNVSFNVGSIPWNAANAGSDIYSPSNTTVTLGANTPSIGSGSWTIIIGTGGSFTDATNPTTTFTGANNTSYLLRWTVTGCYNSRVDDVNVYIGNVVGQNAYGGVIFYVDGTGTSGLVVSTTSQGLQRWTCTNSNISTGTAIGTGNANTTAIVDATCGATPYAANTCRNLVLNGFSDWFLPSINELQQLRLRRNIVNLRLLDIGGAPIVIDWYWTSTQLAPNNARMVLMNSGSLGASPKTSNRRFRAIRAF